MEKKHLLVSVCVESESKNSVSPVVAVIVGGVLKSHGFFFVPNQTKMASSPSSSSIEFLLIKIVFKHKMNSLKR